MSENTVTPAPHQVTVEVGGRPLILETGKSPSKPWRHYRALRRHHCPDYRLHGLADERPRLLASHR